jgi:hypothetical protein
MAKRLKDEDIVTEVSEVESCDDGVYDYWGEFDDEFFKLSDTKF